MVHHKTFDFKVTKEDIIEFVTDQKRSEIEDQIQHISDSIEKMEKEVKELEDKAVIETFLLLEKTLNLGVDLKKLLKKEKVTSAYLSNHNRYKLDGFGEDLYMDITVSLQSGCSVQFRTVVRKGSEEWSFLEKALSGCYEIKKEIYDLLNKRRDLENDIRELTPKKVKSELLKEFFSNNEEGKKILAAVSGKYQKKIESLIQNK